MFLKIFTVLAVISLALATYEFDNHNDYPSNPSPYAFGYELQGHHGSQFRKEQGDASGAVRGSYGFTDERGMRREVHYVADANGFRAQVKSNEPGVAAGNSAPADVHFAGAGFPAFG